MLKCNRLLQASLYPEGYCATSTPLYLKMSTIRLLLLHGLSGSTASPITTTSNTSIPISLSERSIWDILWSCLATMFTVTWVSVHPNAPSLEEPSYVIFRRRVFLMSIALLAPELMVLWAFKQWKGAKMIRDVVNGSLPESRKPPSSL